MDGNFAVKIAQQVQRKLGLLLVGTILLGGCLSDETSETPSISAPVPPINLAPTISGAAPTAITIGTEYSFTPTANDPDGDTLSFNVQNLPRWASFDESTGQLFGVPSLESVGLYSGVQISVSDGTATASLPQFGIDVTSVALGSLTVSWVAPTTNEDGSVLTDLAGYKLFFGTSANNLNTMVRIDNPSITTYVVENLGPNTYFFSATSFNSRGIEGDLSDTSSGVVN